MDDVHRDIPMSAYQASTFVLGTTVRLVYDTGL